MMQSSHPSESHDETGHRIDRSENVSLPNREESLRQTGLTAIGEVPWGSHFCIFYETKRDLLDILVPYFKAGLTANELCLWVVSPPLTVEEAKGALGEEVPDLNRHLAERNLEIHAYDEWYLHNGRCDPQRVLLGWGEKLNQALAAGYAGLRVSGDGSWVQKDDWMVFRDYEKEVDALVMDRRRILLCTYSLAASPGDQVFDVACIHQMAMARRRGSWEMVETSELKQAKAEIRRLSLAAEVGKQTEDRARMVIDTIPTMAWSLGSDGLLDFVNERWLDYTGVSFQDAIREPTGIVHPDDLPRVLKKWHGSMAAGQSSEDEMRLRRADGEYRWFLVRTVPLRDEQGNIIKWYGVSIDIEDRMRAEMESRALIDAIPQQIWSGPPDGTNDYVNERWRSETGLTLEEMRGDGWRTLLHPEDRDRVLKAWHYSVLNGTPYEQEERHRSADGTYRWYLNRGVPLRDPEGRIVRWYGTNTDIEDRKRTEKDLEDAHRQLKILSRRRVKVQEEERRHLARELHDEIGQALTAAKINLQAAIEEPDRAKSKRIEETTAILERLLGQVRQISLNLRPSTLDDLGLVPALRSLLDQQGRLASVAVRFSAKKMPENLDPEIQTTCFRIAQEAITNAVRHAKATQIRVDLSHENGNLRLQVRDNGRGFDAETTQAQTIGLGLLGMKERAALVGGRTRIAASRGKGATVDVTLPLTTQSENHHLGK